LAWCDRPALERPPLAVPRLRIYQVDPSTPPAARAVSSEELGPNDPFKDFLNQEMALQDDQCQVVASGICSANR
jgi:hypothetical protein